MIRGVLAAGLAAALLAGCAATGDTAGGSGAAIELSGAGSPDRFVARGLDPAGLDRLQAGTAEPLQAVLTVHLGEPADIVPGRPALVGSWSRSGGAVTFVPRFPLEPGLGYTAVVAPGPWLPGAPGTGLVRTFRLPAAGSRPSTVVSRVFPSADVLPENQLKFYVHFSAPMREGDAYASVRLVDEERGMTVRAAFLELGEELWDPDFRRFTLFFDPGRVKRELRPREEAGPPLRAGGRYRLEIDAAWRDAGGRPLAAGHVKRFRVEAPDRERPLPSRWKLEVPRAGTREPLEVAFGEPLDHALALRMLRVIDARGRELPGAPRLADAERVWRYTPDRPWPGGPLALEVDRNLEDLAGNSVGRAFEVDTFRAVQRSVLPALTTLGFTPRR